MVAVGDDVGLQLKGADVVGVGEDVGLHVVVDGDVGDDFGLLIVLAGLVAIHVLLDTPHTVQHSARTGQPGSVLAHSSSMLFDLV